MVSITKQRAKRLPGEQKII